MYATTDVKLNQVLKKYKKIYKLKNTNFPITHDENFMHRFDTTQINRCSDV